MLQDFESVSDHFATLQSKGLKVNNLFHSNDFQSGPSSSMIITNEILH